MRSPLSVAIGGGGPVALSICIYKGKERLILALAGTTSLYPPMQANLMMTKTVFAFFCILFSSLASLSAQATRTWVSGVGDDANPGSRTAPCKTFAGAISKTAAGGEISVLDPGGFGVVTITKSMTLNGDGTLASILATGANGIIINAGVNDVVVLRSLSIKNSGGGVASPSGLHGIKILQAGAVHIENCVIQNGTDRGISFEPANSGAQLHVKNCTIIDCSGGGIRLSPVTAALANLTGLNIQRCRFGIRVDQGAKVTAKDCVFTGSVQTGVGANGTCEINLENCTITSNTGGGINSGNGGSGSIVRLSNSIVTNNAGQGLQASGGSQIISFRNNTISGNGPDGSPTSNVAQN